MHAFFFKGVNVADICIKYYKYIANRKLKKFKVNIAKVKRGAMMQH